MTQLTVFPVAFAAVPANTEIVENTLAAKLRCGGSAVPLGGDPFTARGGSLTETAATAFSLRTTTGCVAGIAIAVVTGAMLGSGRARGTGRVA